jgi:hypothetical protein
MIVCYLRNDSEIEAERCRISLGDRSPTTLFALDDVGRISCVTGVVLSIQFDPSRAIGMRWRVEMDVSTIASTDLTTPVASAPAKPASRTNSRAPRV